MTGGAAPWSGGRTRLEGPKDRGFLRFTTDARLGGAWEEENYPLLFLAGPSPC